jgi:hypothetical protein
MLVTSEVEGKGGEEKEKYEWQGVATPRLPHRFIGLDANGL